MTLLDVGDPGVVVEVVAVHLIGTVVRHQVPHPLENWIMTEDVVNVYIVNQWVELVMI